MKSTRLLFSLGMLLVGFFLRNVPVLNNLVQIHVKWSAALRNIALSIILARAGLGLDPKVMVLCDKCSDKCIMIVGKHYAL